MAIGEAQLEVLAGRATGMSITVDDELVIGRHAEGVGRLADDDEISRAHARVTVDRGGFCSIEDLGSTNGTYVNGLRIATPTTLGTGDTIEVGATTLMVRSAPAPGTPAPLSLRVDVDFAAGEARLRLDDASEPVRFVLDGSTWRSESARSDEKGSPP